MEYTRADRAVQVTGVGLVSALGVGVDATYTALRRGSGGARPLDALGLPPGFLGHPCAPPDGAALGLGRGELRYLSPAMRLLHAATREAVADAALVGDALHLCSLGIAVGAHTAERASRSELAALAAGPDEPAAYAAALLARSPLSALRAQPGLLAGLLSQLHGIGGPCLTIVDDITAGGRAVEEACHAIEDGWCDGWITGGTFDLDDPWILCTRGASAPALGSAAAVLVLESACSARTRRARARAVLMVSADDPCSVGAEHAATRDFQALRIAERLGDTLAAAVPLTLVLAVRHLAATATPRLTITPPGLGTAFVLRVPTPRVSRTRPRAAAPALPPAAVALAPAETQEEW